MSDRIGLARCSYMPFSSAPQPPDRVNIDGREAMNAFSYRLSVIHRKIDDAIRRELRLRFPDRMKLLRLKKLRLVVKDRLHHGFRGRRGNA